MEADLLGDCEGEAAPPARGMPDSLPLDIVREKDAGEDGGRELRSGAIVAKGTRQSLTSLNLITARKGRLASSGYNR